VLKVSLLYLSSIVRKVSLFYLSSMVIKVSLIYMSIMELKFTIGYLSGIMVLHVFLFYLCDGSLPFPGLRSTSLSHTV
jgi:hypothetical protein